MPEKLLTARDVYRRLGISEQQFYRLREKLIAAGLRPVVVTAGGRVRYTEVSLDRLINKAATRETPIIKDPPLVKIGQGDFAREINT
jgi:predicted DNA-binding transcriptional regulator AlpA